MDEIELVGDHYELGRQYGQILDDVGFAPEPLSTEKREFVRDCEPAVEEHTPYLREELRGLADAGDWDLERIEAMPLALGYEAGCSVIAVSGEHTVDGNPRFGRNYDFFESFGDFSELYRTRPPDHLASVGCSDHWVGRHDGINEAGVAIGHTFVPNDGSEPGIMFGLAARAVLDTCRTVDDAVSFLERIPHARNTNFLVADAAGDIASIEASPEAVATTRPTNGFGAVTNHFQSESMLEYERREERTESSETRLENLDGWFDTQRDGFDTADVQRVLTDPENGVCSCADGNEDDPILTLWSWAVTPGGTPSMLAKGSPTDVGYESVDL
ncbi:C45 family peptidase [Halocatena halophila]|uniref:C45 family peptidase n=1 Tax=Halocatena halophila TaxID=2814576 RepID=UPI002ED5ECD2